MFDGGNPHGNDMPMQSQGLKPPATATILSDSVELEDETPNGQWRLLRDPLPSDQLVTATEKISAFEREVAEQITTMSEQLHWLREAFEQLSQEKALHGQDIGTQMTALREVRTELELERRTREALEGQCAACTRSLEEQLHATSSYQADLVKEQVEAFKKVTYEGLQQLTQEIGIRLAGTEERLASLESESRANAAAGPERTNTERGSVERSSLADRNSMERMERCSLEARSSIVERGSLEQSVEGLQQMGGVAVSCCVPSGFSETREKFMQDQHMWRSDSRKRLPQHTSWGDHGVQPTDLERKLSQLKDAQEGLRSHVYQERERELQGLCSWARGPVSGNEGGANTPRTAMGGGSPLRTRPQMSTLDLPAAAMASAAAAAGNSPLRTRPTLAVEQGQGVSPMRLRGTAFDSSAVVAPLPGACSPMRQRFAGSSLISAGTPVAAASCLASAGAPTPRGSPPPPGSQLRGRTVASSAANLPCGGLPGNGQEVRKQSLSPVRQMFLITKNSMSGGGSLAGGNSTSFRP